MRLGVRSALCVLAGAAPSPAQNCSGDAGILLTVSDASPTIGSPFTLTTQTTVGDVVLLLVGFGGASTQSPYGTICVTLPAAIVPFVQFAPSVALPASIPFDANFVGVTPHFQFLSAAVGSSLAHRSNGLGVTIEDVAGSDFPGRSYAMPKNPGDLVLGDLNGDSALDLVTPCSTDGIVSIGLGNGAGEFANTTPLLIPDSPSASLLRDLDSDGDLDLFIVRNGGILVWKGNGAASFTPASSITGMSAPRALTSGDFDLDGQIDLAASDGLASSVRVARGLGNGSFSAVTSYPVGATPWGIDNGDLNGDGDPDLAIAHTGVPSGAGILFGSAGTTFVNVGTQPTGNQAVDLVIVDFDDDGGRDLAVTNHLSDDLTVLRNKTSFFASTTYAIGNAPFGLVATDLDGDSHVDIVVANRGADSLGLLRGDGLGFFAPMAIHETGALPEFVVAGDLDGDARPDLVTARSYDHAVSIDLDRDGRGFGLEGTPSVPVIAGLRAAALGDLDSDALLDVVGVDISNSMLRRFSGDGVGGFAAEVPVAVPTSPIDVVTADLDNDSHLDVVTSSQGLATFGVLLGDGAGNLASSTQPGLISGILATGDLDSDGTIDLVSVGKTPVGFSTTFQSFLGLGDGTFVSMPTVSSPDDPSDIALGDLDLDGDLDALVTNTSTNAPRLLRGDGLGGFTPAAGITLNDISRAVALADLDGDGDLDATIANGNLARVTPFYANGPLTFALGTPVFVDATVSAIAIADLDGDHRLDMALARNLESTVRIAYRHASGGYTTQRDFRSILGNATILIGAIDGNERPDIITAANATPYGISVLLHR